MKIRLGGLIGVVIGAMVLLSACLPSGQAWIRTSGSQRDTFGGSTVQCPTGPFVLSPAAEWVGKDGHGHRADLSLQVRIEGDLQAANLTVHGVHYVALSTDPIVRYNPETNDYSTNGKLRLTDVDDQSRTIDLEAILACPD